MRPTSSGSHSDAVATAGLKQWFALRQTTSGDATEEACLTQALLTEIYKRPFDAREALSVLPSCPEVGWLVECHCRAPMPSGWRKSKVAPGDAPDYYSEASGETAERAPFFGHFIRLAELSIRVRLEPGQAARAKAMQGVRSTIAELQRTATDIDRQWTGPHHDDTSGEEYYHNPRTGDSVWDSPGSWAQYIVMVAERLLHSEAFVLLSSAGSRLEAAEARAEASEAAARAAAASAAKGATDPLAAEGLQRLEAPGDAWGALDALLELGEDAPAGDGHIAHWAEMERWIASQPKAPSGSAAPAGTVQLAAAKPAAAKSAPSGGYPTDAGAAVARAPDPKRLPPKPQLPAVPTSLPAVPIGRIAKAPAPKACETAAMLPPPAPAPPAGSSGASTAVPAPAPAPASAACSTAAAPPARPKEPPPSAGAPAAASAAAATAAAPAAAAPKAPKSTVARPPDAAAGPEVAKAVAAPLATAAPPAVASAPAATAVAATAAAELPSDLPSLALALAELAPDGCMAGPEASDRVRQLLEAIEQQPASFEILRDTKLGIITKPYKDSPDPAIKAAASRLRKAWKEMLVPKK